MTLSNNWDDLSLHALWERLNSPEQHPTPQSVVDAVMVSLRARGVAALREPDGQARWGRCDAKAKAEVRTRWKALRSK
jgi:hypothetical protein